MEEIGKEIMIDRILSGLVKKNRYIDQWYAKDINKVVVCAKAAGITFDYKFRKSMLQFLESSEEIPTNATWKMLKFDTREVIQILRNKWTPKQYMPLFEDHIGSEARLLVIRTFNHKEVSAYKNYIGEENLVFSVYFLGYFAKGYAKRFPEKFVDWMLKRFKATHYPNKLKKYGNRKIYVTVDGVISLINAGYPYKKVRKLFNNLYWNPKNNDYFINAKDKKYWYTSNIGPLYDIWRTYYGLGCKNLDKDFDKDFDYVKYTRYHHRYDY